MDSLDFLLGESQTEEGNMPIPARLSGKPKLTRVDSFDLARRHQGTFLGNILGNILVDAVKGKRSVRRSTPYPLA
eukprot:4079835-Pyramimonas_sp.AAC.1